MGDLSKGIAMGLGTALLAPLAIPAIAHAARPLLRSAVKSGVLLLVVSKEAMAEASETFEDIVAEVKAELAERHKQMAGSAAEAAASASAVDTDNMNGDT